MLSSVPVLPLVFSLVVQALPLDYTLLVEEDARGDTTALVEALENDHPTVQLQALRALGRFERPALAFHITPFLDAQDPQLRIEAANALAQIGVSRGLEAALDGEGDPRVRGALFASLGRSGASTSVAGVLATGLEDDRDEAERQGAVRGLEHLARRLPELELSESTIAALRRMAVSASASALPGRTKRLALEVLLRVEDSHTETLESALSDSDPQVRRLAVRGLSRPALDDSSHIVRLESLEAAFDCRAAEHALQDVNEHVVLRAIDKMSDGCDASPLAKLSIEDDDWRRGGHVLTTLARIAPDEAARRLARFARHEVWQARVYAARAALLLEDEATLALLRHDDHPNVASEALRTPEDALDAIGRYTDYGLLMKALSLLEGASSSREVAESILEKLREITQRQHATSRDPRRLMLDRLSEWKDDALVPALEPYLEDFDPAIARRAAEILSETRARDVTPRATRFESKPPPSEPRLLRHGIRRARVVMREAGPFTIELFPEEAPFTVAQFLSLAERGYYDGLTFHRIVPNFVIQGGSPGANEYEGFADYIRDEVGLLPHERGTLGISTRGRDTGDSQIFVNLVDNPRLDHAYTVFARVVEGMENVDQILEGDVMESIVATR